MNSESVNQFRVLEAIVTTENEDGSQHVAPMGPLVSTSRAEWILKPFQTSTTFTNLRRSNRCVVNVTDDALLMAKAVLGTASHEPSRFVEGVGYVLKQACHWYALSIHEWDCSQPRAVARCIAMDHGLQHSFFGWNRAKHAVVELAIHVSRKEMLDPIFLQSEVERLKVLIDKTASEQERCAFDLLIQHIDEGRER